MSERERAWRWFSAALKAPQFQPCLSHLPLRKQRWTPLVVGLVGRLVMRSLDKLSKHDLIPLIGWVLMCRYFSRRGWGAPVGSPRWSPCPVDSGEYFRCGHAVVRLQTAHSEYQANHPLFALLQFVVCASSVISVTLWWVAGRLWRWRDSPFLFYLKVHLARADDYRTSSSLTSYCYRLLNLLIFTSSSQIS